MKSRLKEVPEIHEGRRNLIASVFAAGRTIALIIFLAVLMASCGSPESRKVKHYQKGLILMERGRYAAAVAEYEKALAIDPEMAEVHYELGRCYSNLKQYEKAVSALVEARALDPQLTLGALLRIADVYAISGRPLLAEQSCHEALEVDPESVDIMVFLGKLKLDAEDTAAARSWLEKALAADPNHVECRFALSQIAMESGQFAIAEEHLKKITTDLDPANTAARLALAKVYRFSNQENKAIETLQQILKDNPHHIQARGALAEAYLSVNRLDEAQTEAEAFLEALPMNLSANSLLGTILLKQRDYESAVIYLTKAANSPTASAEIHFFLGLALIGTNKPAQAISSFQKALTMDPDNIACRLALVQALLKEGSFEKAQREINLVLAKEPENEQAKQLWVRADVLQKAFEQVDTLLASKGIPDEIAEDIKAGLKAFRAGDLQKAQTLCESASKNTPNSPLPLNLLGLVYLRQNEFEKALAQFRDALNVDPEFAASYINIANIYIAVGSHEEAVRAYRKALELSPNDNTVALRFVKALTLLKQHEEAETFLRNRIQDNPDAIGYRLVLADMLVSSGRYSDARKELAYILDREPKHANTRHLFAETLAREGDMSGAAASFEILMNAYPRSPDFSAKFALCNLVLGSTEKVSEALDMYSASGKKTVTGELARALVMQNGKEYAEAEKILADLKSGSPEEMSYELMLANVQAAHGGPGADRINDITGTSVSEKFRESYMQMLRSETLGPAELYKLNLGIAQAQVRWYLAGLAKLELIGQEAGHNAAFMELIGGLWEKEGNPEKARSSYESGLAADPSFWPVHYRLGLLALHAGEIPQAEEYFNSALKYNPDSVKVLLALAGAYEKAGNDPEAINTYYKVNELQPDLAPVLNNLAWLLAKNPDTLDEAMKYAELAAAAQPSAPNVLDTLGWILFQNADYGRAKEYLDKAVLLNSFDPSIRYHRGMVYLKLGDEESALNEFHEAASAMTSFPERDLNEEMIRQLS